MVSWLLPFALLPKTFTSALFENFAQIAFPVFLIFLLVQLNFKPALVQDILPERRTLQIWGALIVLQFILFGWHALAYGDSDKTYGLIHGWFTFMQLIVVIWFAYTIQKIFIRDADSVFKFLASLIISLVVYLVVVIVPQLAVSFRLPFTGWTNFLAGLFERHWDSRAWYDAGSYVATQHRINGFEPEAPFLVMLLGLVFGPILVSIVQEPMKGMKNGRRLQKLVWVLIVVLSLVFLMARSTSGYLMVALLGLFTVLFAPRSTRKWLFITGAASLAVVISAYFFVPAIHDIFEKWLFAKQGTDNRLGGAIGLLQTFIHHPFFGVGFGNEGNFIEQFLPGWSKSNSEYINFYSKTAYPVLNDFLGWLARFGAIVVVSAIWLLGGLIVRSVNVYRQLVQSDKPEQIEYRIVIRAFFVIVPLTLMVAMITQINAFSWPMLLMYFFYWRVIHLAEDNVSKSA